MSEISGVGERDKTKPNAFPSLVHYCQDQWRLRKQTPVTEFSQAIDLPDALVHNFTNTIVQNLPSFVPEAVRRKLIEEHPNPIIAVGVLADKRILSRGWVETSIKIPGHLKIEEDIESWFRGIELLDEIATDTLADEVMKSLAKSNIWFKTLSVLPKEAMAYRKGLWKAKNIFGGEEPFEQFKKSLVLAMLTGNKKVLNTNLRKLGHGDVDDLALEIGREAKYSNGVKEIVDKVNGARILVEEVIDPSKSEKSKNDPQEVSLARTRLNLIGANGFVSLRHPGIISVNTAALNAISAFNLYIGYLSAQNIYKIAYDPLAATIGMAFALWNGYYVAGHVGSIPHTIIHEACHYLGFNTKHNGLRDLAYVRKSSQNVRYETQRSS